MKQQELKLAQNSQTNCFQKIITAVIVIIFCLIIAFTFQTIHEINELKFTIKTLQNEVKDLRETVSKFNELNDQSDIHSDYQQSNDIMTKNPNMKNEMPNSMNGRNKRSIVTPNQDGTINSDSMRRKNSRNWEFPYGYSRRHRVNRQEQSNSEELNLDVEVVTPTGRVKPLPAAHYSGDTSRYDINRHDNFKGNGHLRHLQRTFVDWSESNWFRSLGMEDHFSLNEGFLTIKSAGLYFIYAQIYYYDEHDLNGFRVHKNDNETLLQCTTMTHSLNRVMKGNTCFTAGVSYLQENDKISIRDLSESRYSVFGPGKSFFGVIKLSDVKI